MIPNNAPHGLLYRWEKNEQMLITELKHVLIIMT